MAKRICDVPECANEISDGCGSKGGRPICQRCRSEQYRSAKQSEKELQARRDRWAYWESRLDYLHPRIVKAMADAERRVASARKLGASARH